MDGGCSATICAPNVKNIDTRSVHRVTVTVYTSICRSIYII